MLFMQAQGLSGDRCSLTPLQPLENLHHQGFMSITEPICLDFQAEHKTH